MFEGCRVHVYAASLCSLSNIATCAAALQPFAPAGWVDGSDRILLSEQPKWLSLEMQRVGDEGLFSTERNFVRRIAGEENSSPRTLGNPIEASRQSTEEEVPRARFMERFLCSLPHALPLRSRLYRITALSRNYPYD